MADLDPLKFKIEIDDQISASLNEIKNKLNSLKDEKITIQGDGGKGLSKDVIGEIDKIKASIEDMTSKYEAAKRELESMRGALEQQAKAAQSAATSIKSASDATVAALEAEQKKLNDLIALRDKYSQAEIAARNNMLAAIQKGMNTGKDTSDEQLKYLNEQDKAKALVAETSKAIEQQEKKIQALTKTQQESTQVEQKKAEALNKEAEAAKNAADANDKLAQKGKVSAAAKGLAEVDKNATKLGENPALDNQNDKVVNLEANLRKYNNVLADSEKLLMRLDAASNKGFGLGLDTTLTRTGSRDVYNFIEQARRFTDKEDTEALNNLIAQYQRLKTVYGDIAATQERLNKKVEADRTKSAEAAIRDAQRAADAEIRSAEKSADAVAKANERKRAEMAKAWAEQDKQREKDLQSANKQMERDLAAKQKGEQQKRDAAYKAAEQEAADRQRANEKMVRDSERAEAQMIASKLRAAQQYSQTLEQVASLLSRFDIAGQKSAMLGIDNGRGSKAMSELQTLFGQLSHLDPSKISSAETINALAASFSNLQKSIVPVVKEQERLIAQREKILGMSAENYAQGRVNLFSNQNTDEIRKQIDAVGALYSRVQKLQEAQGKTPRSWVDALGIDYKKYGSYRDTMDMYAESMRRMKAELEQMKSAGIDVGNYERQLAALFATYEKFAALQTVDIGKKLGLEHLRGYTGPQSAASDATWAAMKRQAEIQEVAGEAAKKHQRKLVELTNAFAQHDAQVAKSQRIQAGDNNARRESVEVLRRQARELVKARMEMLRAQSADLGKLLSSGRGKLGAEQYENVRNALRGIREEMRQLEGVMQRMGSYSIRDLFGFGRGGGMNYAPLIANTKELISAKEQASAVTRQLTADEQRLAQAMGQTGMAARSQSQMLSDLKSLATQYLGVWGGQQFLHNIIEIGGQLEMQRLSIGAILQNQAQANDLFEKIKGLAVRSPFGVVELDQMTKQLTAYGFKYNELFDWTKRLADISAATGTGVDRLALALGHVRSEAALSGYTLRQFSMGNIPLLQKLSEKLGKTTEEIRKMVRGKQISYDDVIGVLKDLTDEGGMFYNMQEVISESVKAKFKNVKDAMDIMYGEMAEGAPGDALKEVATALMEVTRNWKDVATVLGTGAAVWGIQRAAVLLYTKTLGASATATWASIRATQVATADNNLFALSYRKLTAAEKEHIVIGTKNIAGQLRRRIVARLLNVDREKAIALSRREIIDSTAVALSEKKVTVETLARSVATGKLSKVEAELIIHNSTLSVSEKTLGLQTIKNVRTFGAWTGVINGASMALGRLGMALKGLFLNPMMLMMAGLTAVMELWQRNSSEMEKSGELADNLFQRMTEGVKNVKQVMELTGMSFTVDGKNNIDNYGVKPGVISFPSADSLDSASMKEAIDTWTTFIKDYSATPNLMLNAANATNEAGEAVHSLAEQYEILGNNAITVMNALPLLKDLSLYFKEAINDSDAGLFDDSLLTDMKDYEEAYQKHQKRIATTASIFRRQTTAALNAARGNEAFRKAVEDAGISAENTAAQIMLLADNAEEFKEAKQLFTEAWKNEQGGADIANFFQTGKMREQFQELDSEFAQFATKVKQYYEGIGWDFANLKPEQKQALGMSIAEMMTEAGLSVDEVRNKIMELAKEHFKIDIDVNTAQTIAEVTALKNKIKEILGHDLTINIGTATDFFEVMEKVQKEYKAAKEKMEKAPAIMLKMGMKFSIGAADELTDKQIEQLSGGNALKKAFLISLRDAQRVIKDATKLSETTGFKLEEPKSGGSGSKKKSGGGSAKTYKDEFAKRWDERIRIMKEAYSWYDKWNKEVGQDEALAKVVEKYGDIFEQWRTDKLLPFDFDVKDIDHFIKYVKEIKEAAQARYKEQTATEANRKKFNNGEEALRVFRTATNVLSEYDFDNFKKAAGDFKSIIEEVISDLNDRWDIYKKVRDATSNESVARAAAGFDYVDLGARTAADALRNELEQQIRDAGGASVWEQLSPLDLNIDTEGLRKKLQDAIPQAEDAERYKESIEGILKAYEKWQDLQKKVNKDDISVFAQLLGTAAGYDAKIQKINDKLQKQIDSLQAGVMNGSVPLEQAQYAEQMATTQADWEKLKLSAEYANLYNNTVALSRDEFLNAAHSVEVLLGKLHELGMISPEEYTSEMGKIDKARSEWFGSGFLGEKGAVASYIGGGYSGLKNYYAERRDAAREIMARNDPESEEYKNAAKVADEYGALVEGMTDAENSIKKVSFALETLQAGLSLVGNMFDALGAEGAANAVGDVTSVMGSAMSGANALSALGPWGMAAGAGLGLITGIAQTHDNALQREIEKLNKQVKSIEANTELIAQVREREFGLDSGDLRRALADEYGAAYQESRRADDAIRAEREALRGRLSSSMGISYWRQIGGSNAVIKSNTKALKSMYDYYNRNTEGSGYMQEYQNLLDMREKQLRILGDQERLKKKSQSDIDETRKKIAELDDQIKYFTRDLAKELWDIDVKSWAQQLNDALCSAFENGENAAKAYNDTVKSILQDIKKKMMNTIVFEKMFQKLQSLLDEATSGLLDDPARAATAVVDVLGRFFGAGGEGDRLIAAAAQFDSAFESALGRYGLSTRGDEASTLSSSIQGTSEETSDLLAGYVNALRQDVAINRLMLTQFVATLWPAYIEAFSNQVSSVANIDNNVQMMMMMMRDGSGAMYDEIHSMRSRIDNVVNGIESFTMR